MTVQPRRRRKSSRLSSKWVLVADRTGSALQKYHLVQLDGPSIEHSLESSFPNSILRVLPAYMNTALAAIKSKSIHCSFFSETLLDQIGKMATKSSYSDLMQEFDSEESFVTFCIEAVYCRYIFDSLALLKNDATRPMTRDGYFKILKKCKDDSKLKQKKRRCNESYLGKNRFSNELHRSFDEFIAKVVVTLGFLPLKVK